MTITVIKPGVQQTNVTINPNTTIESLISSLSSHSDYAGDQFVFVNGRQLGAGLQAGYVLAENDVVTFSKKIVGGR